MNNDRFESLDGYRVITPGGKLIGEVARVSETAIIVHLRRLGRSIYRPLPREFARRRLRRAVAAERPAGGSLSRELPPDSTLKYSLVRLGDKLAAG